MTITVVGSIAFDSVATYHQRRERMLGGAATHFALSASFFDAVSLVGAVGEDFGDAHMAALRRRGSNVEDVQRIEGARTFFWSGEYSRDLNAKLTLDAQLNVFESFQPQLSSHSRACEVLFLANMPPTLQLQVREQCSNARFVALDSMKFWIDAARDELVEVIGRVDCVILNDAELRQLSRQPTLVTAAREVLGWGPSIVVTKHGTYGATLLSEHGFFAVPAYPVETALDPTGAGDTFAGGFVGYIARHLRHSARPLSDSVLRNALAYGTALASFNVEEFGAGRLERLTIEEICSRVDELARSARLGHVGPERVREHRVREPSADPSKVAL